MQGQYIKKVQFKAGKMNFENETKKVSADHRMGNILVYHDLNNEKHFQWIDSSTQLIENDLYIFGEDARFEMVPQTDGRVCLLSFQSYEDKMFFWLQEQDQQQDSEWVKQVNQVINNPEIV